MTSFFFFFQLNGALFPIFVCHFLLHIQYVLSFLYTYVYIHDLHEVRVHEAFERKVFLSSSCNCSAHARWHQHKSNAFTMNEQMNAKKRADFGKHIRKYYRYHLVYLPILIMCLQWVIVKLKGIWTRQNAPFSFSFTHAVFCSSSTDACVCVGLSCFSEWKPMQHVAPKLIQKQTPP